MNKQFKTTPNPFRKSSSDGNGSVNAVDNINLKIKKGELFGLMGPNGAGKTTLTKILCTLIVPTSGKALINGYDVATQEDKIKRSIGLVTGEDRSFFYRLSCLENLFFFSALYNLSSNDAGTRIEYLSHLLSLKEFLDKRFDKCSAGMKQRLAIARALLGNPEILFFDEPTKSLDPSAAQNLRRTIKSLTTDGYTILFVTHRLEEAEEICDRVGVMTDGKLEILDSTDNLRSIFCD